MATVKIQESGSVAGIWVSEGNKQIGIIAEDGKGAYIAFYDTSKNLVPVALAFNDSDNDGNNELLIQLPDGSPSSCKIINISALMGVMKKTDGKSS